MFRTRCLTDAVVKTEFTIRGLEYMRLNQQCRSPSPEEYILCIHLSPSAFFNSPSSSHENLLFGCCAVWLTSKTACHSSSCIWHQTHNYQLGSVQAQRLCCMPILHVKCAKLRSSSLCIHVPTTVVDFMSIVIPDLNLCVPLATPLNSVSHSLSPVCPTFPFLRCIRPL